jgi:hypothetical protein
LTLTHRSFIGDFDKPYAFACTPDASRVFVADRKQISCIDVRSGAVRSFVDIPRANGIRLADGLLYAVHGDGLSVIHAESGAIQQSAVQQLYSWSSAGDLIVFPVFICIADTLSECVHIIQTVKPPALRA